jgi:hypothetical protein
VNDVLAKVNWLSIPEVAEKLNLPLGKVHRLLEEHMLIEARIDGVRKIPADAIQDGEPLPSLRGTIFLLMDCGLDQQGILEWLYTPEESLGATPMAALLEGKKSPVRRAAQTLG